MCRLARGTGNGTLASGTRFWVHTGGNEVVSSKVWQLLRVNSIPGSSPLLSCHLWRVLMSYFNLQEGLQGWEHLVDWGAASCGSLQTTHFLGLHARPAFSVRAGGVLGCIKANVRAGEVCLRRHRQEESRPWLCESGGHRAVVGSMMCPPVRDYLSSCCVKGLPGLHFPNLDCTNPFYGDLSLKA